MQAAKGKKEMMITKTAHKTSEKLAEPIAPIGLGAEVKVIADAHSKVTGKKSWVAKHSTDLTIFLGLLWCIFRVVDFFYPEVPWTNWTKIIDVFLPAVFMLLAMLYRLYPTVNMFFSRNKS
jgi:hypothetical protein